MKIPFTKAHGAKNDFLFTWRRDAPDPAAGGHAAPEGLYMFRQRTAAVVGGQDHEIVIRPDLLIDSFPSQDAAEPESGCRSPRRITLAAACNSCGVPPNHLPISS